MWSEEEIKYLVSERERGALLKDLSGALHRTKPAIEAKLEELLADTFESAYARVQGPQVLLPEFWGSLFEERLTRIFRGLLVSDATVTWKAALKREREEALIQAISAGIPEQVKQILGDLKPPDFTTLLSLPRVDTTRAGVYARLMHTTYKLQMPRDRYIYVGSSARPGSGLNGRVADHTSGYHTVRRLKRDIKKNQLKRPGHFITLMSIGRNTSPMRYFMSHRRLSVLAEAILSVWLGAIQDPSRSLRDLCAWDVESLGYRPWCSHNPLILDIIDSEGDGHGEARERDD
ncbi:hypothetical protein ABW19_dt0202778 [Dactylella cylindrospora]|nr:hypothetical protein ABW19_dt0202778 [Dactylella cylindrospora]